MSRRFAASAAIVFGVVGATVSFGSASFAEGADKQPLIGPNAEVLCDNLVPLHGDAPDAGPGFVIFNKSSDSISALVVLHDAEPNTSYTVRLLQDNDGSCHDVDGVLVTNDRGHGTLRWSEPDVGNVAQVIINTDSLSRTPIYRGTDVFPTD
jgi:hypothetical protein